MLTRTRPSGQLTSLKFNVDDTRLQICTITGKVDAVVNFRIVPESEKCRAKLAEMTPAERRKVGFKHRGRLSKPSVVKFLKRKNAEGFAIFFTLNATDDNGVKRENMIAARCLPLDLDGTPLPEAFEINPHLIVNTSRGKFQCFWPIRESQDFAAYEDTARRLAAHYGGDSAVCDIAHVFRAAGFYHWKGHPFRSRIVQASEFEPPATIESFNFLPKLPPRTESTASGVGSIDADKARLILSELNAPDFAGNDSWLALAMAMHAASAGDSEVGDLFLEWSTRDPAYADEGAEALNRTRWDSFRTDKPNMIGIGTLQKICCDHGVPDDTIAKVFNDAANDFGDEPEQDFDFDTPADEEEFESESAEITPVEERGLRVKGNDSVAPDTFENALIAVRRSGLDIAWDELKHNAVIRTGALPWDESYGRVLNDNLGRLIRVYLMNRFQGNAYAPQKEHLYEALFTVAYSSKFNPVIEYLDSLNWDGTFRVENLFAEYFNCGDDSYTRAVSRCFMVGAVRRMRRPGCKFDTMPVLKSPQGWNKSTAIKVLFGVDWYSDADLGNLSNKDASMKLRGIWAQEFAEIDSLSHAGVGTLKAFMSRAVDRQRDPYNRIVEDVPRRCVFVGTVNEGGYLKDTTGARRFWPMDLQARIDLEALAADRDQLWAEAAAMEAAGESDVLPQDLWPVAAERQAAQTTADPWCDTITALLTQRANAFAAYDPDDDEEGEGPPPSPDKIHTRELFGSLDIPDRDQTKGYSQRLRTVMEALGWTHAKSVRIDDDVFAGYVRDK